LVSNLRDKHRLRVFYNRVLRIFKLRPKAIGEWEKLHNEELHNFYSTPNIIRMSRPMMHEGLLHMEVHKIVWLCRPYLGHVATKDTAKPDDKKKLLNIFQSPHASRH
jgi:hypothetical protein